MKIRHFAFTVLVLLLGLAACTLEDPVDSLLPEDMEGTAITFTATIDGGWKYIASVAVMIDNTVKEYIVWASANDDYTNATLRSDDPHYWTSSDDITVTAWWPYTEGETTLPDVVVKADQSSADSFEGSYSFSAEDQKVAYDDSPTLSFTHRTARVTVNLVAGDGLTSYDLAGATVSLINLSEENGNPSTITPYDAGSDTYEALVAPQTIAAGSSFIQVKLDNEIFHLSSEDYIVLNAGYHYTYTIKVNATGLTLVGSTIGEWESGNSNENGVANENFGDYIYDSDTGTYTVYTADGLLAWNEAAQTDLELNCTLAAHIDLTDKDWTPIGNETNPYTGTFEGRFYSIMGLTVNKGSTDYVGLIGGLGSDGKVQNLTLYNVSITGSTRVGGVVGINSGIVTDCTISGNVSGNSSYVGGVAGFNYGTITACYSTGSVSGSGDNVGGVVGQNEGTVTTCYSTGSVSASRRLNIGGVVGRNGGIVTACFSTGSVSASSSDGGVVGYNNGTVTACYFAGDSVSGSWYTGGVVGENKGTVIACYSRTEIQINGGECIGGVVGWNSGATVVACYFNGSISGSATEIGGVVGRHQNSELSSCYYGGSVNYGIGSGSGTTIKVTGSWSSAVNNMNAAISNWNSSNGNLCEWEYKLTDDLPTLKKN